jgi:hypothetical protein
VSLRDLQQFFGFGPGVNPSRAALYLISSLVLLVGGPLLGLSAIDRYPWLVGDRFWWGCVAAICGGALLYFVLMRGRWPSWATLPMKVGACFGWSLTSAFLIFGLVAFANGSRSSTEMRDVNCIRKQHSRYLYVEAWPGSDEIAIINTPPVIYHRVHPPAVVRLQIARGALGIEWLQGVSLPDSH